MTEFTVNDAFDQISLSGLSDADIAGALNVSEWEVSYYRRSNHIPERQWQMVLCIAAEKGIKVEHRYSAASIRSSRFFVAFVIREASRLQITDSQLSDVSGVPYPTLWHILNGKTIHPRTGTRDKLEKGLLLWDQGYRPIRGGESSPKVPSDQQFAGEELSDVEFREGKRVARYVVASERDPRARRACLEIFGYDCQICGMDFQSTYGDPAAGIIHVHHVIPLSSIQGDYTPDPAIDLIPLCPNCHAVIHARREMYSVDDVRKMVEAQRRSHDIDNDDK